MNCHTGFERCLCSLGWMFLCTGPKKIERHELHRESYKKPKTLHGLFAILSGTYDSGAVREYVVLEPGWWQWDSQWPVCVAFLFPLVWKPCVLNHWLTCCKAVLSFFVLQTCCCCCRCLLPWVFLLLRMQMLLVLIGAFLFRPHRWCHPPRYILFAPNKPLFIRMWGAATADPQWRPGTMGGRRGHDQQRAFPVYLLLKHHFNRPRQMLNKELNMPTRTWGHRFPALRCRW